MPSEQRLPAVLPHNVIVGVEPLAALHPEMSASDVLAQQRARALRDAIADLRVASGGIRKCMFSNRSGWLTALAISLLG